jgi:CDP-glycerol glycerophosphotransferase (TagB/SpsB family)
MQQIKKAKKGITRDHFIGRAWYKLIRPFYIWYIRKFYKVEKNKILFASKPSFADNAKIFYDYLCDTKADENLKFVWIANKEDRIPESVQRENTTVVRYVHSYYGATFEAMKQILTSEYVCFTHASPFRSIPKREGQYCINLWHGCGYKDMQKKSKKFIEIHPFDKALVPGKVFVKTKKYFWGCDEERILPIGYPRYDLLIRDNDAAHSFAKKMREDNKLIVWMPTFRNTGRAHFPEEQIQKQFDLSLLSSVEQVDELNEYCKKHKIMICIKRHPYQVEYSCEGKNYSNIVFVSNAEFTDANIELYSFLHYTDALISDYSSVAIDYLLLDKPVAFALDDFVQYKDTRGFVFEEPLNYMPGHHLYSYEDLLAFVSDIADGKDPYKESRDALMPETHNPCSNYCERVWNTLKKLGSEGDNLNEK